jgi:hypothetical protein
MTTTVKDFSELFGDLGHYKGGGIEPPTYTMRFKLKDRTIVMSELIFLALDRPQSIKKLRGLQLTGGWLNEIKELPKAILDMLDLRIGRYPSAMEGGPTWYGMIGDTNQCDDDHWLYKLAEEVKPEGWNFFTQPGGLIQDPISKEWIANPLAENLQNLPPDYYVKGKEGKDEMWIRVNLGNQYGIVQDGRPVYAEQWYESIHLNRNIHYNPLETLYVGLDFGLCPSAIFAQQSQHGSLHVIDEIVSQGLGINQFVKELLRPRIADKYAKANIVYVGDPAGNHRAETDEQTVFKELDELGIECIPANTNAIDPRLESVRYYLQMLVGGRPGFQLNPDTCPILRRGFNGGYRFRRIQVVGAERYTSEPDKNRFSHPHDALQYIALHIKGCYDVSSENKFNRDAVEETRWSR